MKPNQGIIPSKGNTHVNIMLILNDIANISSVKDKFQIMFMTVDDNVSSEGLTKLWKDSRGKEQSMTLPVSQKIS